jgi:predicted metal-binding membrane protein
MMTPSAAPMILLYARVGRAAASRSGPFAATGWFTAGYLAIWAGFALIATIAEWGLERAALLTPMLTSSSRLFGGLVLTAVALYQWTPIKDMCLAQCQSPLGFIMRYGGFHGDVRGALAMGLRHGAYCLGCCWAVMALLFVGGVMNVLWIAAIAIFVLIEKLVPVGRVLSRVAGAACGIAGVWLIATSL